MTSASFEELQAQEIEYSKQSMAVVGIVTIALAMSLWFLGHHAFALSLLFLIPASFVDARERLLPDAFLLPALGIALVYCSFMGQAVESSFGAGLGILALMIIFFARPGRVGLGDVKLLGALGAGLGPQGMIASIVLGAIAGIAIFGFVPRYRAHGVPMGPLFVGAAVLVGIASAVVPQWSLGL